MELFDEDPAIRQNLRLKLEKVSLKSKAELAEPSSLAYQRNMPVVWIRPAAEALG
jgi:hypothetical protein